ncbi:MAG: hypothetical protein ACYC35_09450 [Pirellulales bacterium]
MSSVSGHITTDTIWNDVADPYRLTGDLFVDPGVSLTIMPGVTYEDSIGSSLQVDGSLFVLGAFLSGNYQSINVMDGGRADLKDATIDGKYAKVFYEAGSTGMLDNVQGNDWDLTVDSSALTITNGISVDQMELTTPISVSAGTIGDLTVSASATLQGSTLKSITIGVPDPPLGPVAPVVQDNTFTDAVPIRIDDPDALTVNFLGNTYTAMAPAIQISGSLDGARTLETVDGALSKYVMAGEMSVQHGGSLTIPLGTEFQHDSLYPLEIYGTLGSVGATLSGNNQSIEVYSGARADLKDATITGSGLVTYKSGSSGTLDNVRGPLWDLTVESAGVAITNGITADEVNLVVPIVVQDGTLGSIVIGSGAPTVTGNTFSGDIPVRITDPDAQTTGFSGNSFTAPSPRIQISGDLAGNRALEGIEGINTYVLDGDLYVRKTAALSIASGVAFDDNSFFSMKVYGTLTAAGTPSSMDVYSGGRADLVDCPISGNKVISYNSGSIGTLDNVQGNLWDLTIASPLVTVNNGLKVDQFNLSAPLSIFGATIGGLNLSASATIMGGDLKWITLNSGTPVIAGNTITDALPLRITDPDAQTTDFSGNAFTHAAATILISGTLDGARVLDLVDGLNKYRLAGDLPVKAGAVLTIMPGVELEDASNLYNVQVYGNLAAEGAAFSGGYLSINVFNGGDADFKNCTVNGDGYVNYRSGSTGSLDNMRGSEWDLTVASGAVTVTNGISADQVTLSAPIAVDAGTITGVSLSAPATITNSTLDWMTLNKDSGTPTVTGNTFNDYAPLRITDPDAQTLAFSGNTYGVPFPFVEISGNLEGARTLAIIDGRLDWYVLAGDLSVKAGASLTIAPDVDYHDDIDAAMQVYGTLNASKALFSADDPPAVNKQTVNIYNGGKANLSECKIEGKLNFANGSGGKVVYSEVAKLAVNSGSTVLITNNDFTNASFGSISANGDRNATIPMKNNWWGTNNSAGIDDLITDHKDNAVLPTIDYTPWLPEKPLPPTAFVSVVAATLNGGSAQRSAIRDLALQFDADVSASLDTGDLTLANDDTGAPISLSGVTPTYDPATNTATWGLSAISIPDGNYVATLSAAGVTDAFNNPMANDFSFQFFRLLADTNGSRSVDIFDVSALQLNYGQTSGMTPAQGDFDGNGTVDIFDVALLQTQYGKTLSPPAPMPPAEAPPAAMPSADAPLESVASSLAAPSVSSPVGGLAVDAVLATPSTGRTLGRAASGRLTSATQNPVAADEAVSAIVARRHRGPRHASMLADAGVARHPGVLWAAAVDRVMEAQGSSASDLLEFRL